MPTVLQILSWRIQFTRYGQRRIQWGWLWWWKRSGDWHQWYDRKCGFACHRGAVRKIIFYT